MRYNCVEQHYASANIRIYICKKLLNKLIDQLNISGTKRQMTDGENCIISEHALFN